MLNLICMINVDYMELMKTIMLLFHTHSSLRYGKSPILPSYIHKGGANTVCAQYGRYNLHCI